jgi:predicted HAD superfamily phosphohydrolase YqeG
MNHGTRVTRFLVNPWAKTNCVVVGDSLFASVATARELKLIGMRFVGVVKTATKNFPMQWLSSVELRD